MRKYYKIIKLTSLYAVLFVLSFFTPDHIDDKSIKLELENAYADAAAGCSSSGGCAGTSGDAACGACGVGCTDGAACTDGTGTAAATA